MIRWIDRLTLRLAGLGERRRDAPMFLEQVLALDPRRRLCLVRCGDRRLLLLTGGPRDVSLGWLTDPPAS